jgi:hypothetical protein
MDDSLGTGASESSRSVCALPSSSSRVLLVLVVGGRFRRGT